MNDSSGPRTASTISRSKTPRSTVPPSGRGKRIAVVVNGRAKSVNSEVISTLDQILQGGDLFVSRSLEEADEIAEVVVTRGYGTVLTGGGDGTFSVMVTKVCRAAMRLDAELPRFGFLRLGTGNALAHVVGASKGGPGGVAADIQRLREEAGSREISLIDVHDVLTPFCGFGADAMVLQDYERLKKAVKGTPLSRLGTGKMGYVVSSVTQTIPRSLLQRPSYCRVINRGAPCFRVGPSGQQECSVAEGEVLFEGEVRLVGAATIPYFGYGLRAFPHAEERPDRMHLRLWNVSTLPLLNNFRAIWRGSYQNPRRLADFLVEKVEIQMNCPTAYQIGGDYEGEATSLSIGLAPRRIRLVDFYAPPGEG